MKRSTTSNAWFRDNAIDADVLCDLTDEHLRELGLPLGARLKLLRAVAALGTGHTPVSPEIADFPLHAQTRSASGHRDVLRLGRFNGAVGTHGGKIIMAQPSPSPCCRAP